MIHEEPEQVLALPQLHRRAPPLPDQDRGHQAEGQPRPQQDGGPGAHRIRIRGRHGPQLQGPIRHGEPDGIGPRVASGGGRIGRGTGAARPRRMDIEQSLVPRQGGVAQFQVDPVGRERGQDLVSEIAHTDGAGRKALEALAPIPQGVAPGASRGLGHDDDQSPLVAALLDQGQGRRGRRPARLPGPFQGRAALRFGPEIEAQGRRIAVQGRHAIDGEILGTLARGTRPPRGPFANRKAVQALRPGPILEVATVGLRHPGEPLDGLKGGFAPQEWLGEACELVGTDRRRGTVEIGERLDIGDQTLEFPVECPGVFFRFFAEGRHPPRVLPVRADPPGHQAGKQTEPQDDDLRAALQPRGPVPHRRQCAPRQVRTRTPVHRLSAVVPRSMGNRNQTVVPWPGVLTRPMSPPIRATRRRPSASPRPVPPWRRTSEFSPGLNN